MSRASLNDVLATLLFALTAALGICLVLDLHQGGRIAFLTSLAVTGPGSFRVREKEFECLTIHMKPLA